MEQANASTLAVLANCNEVARAILQDVMGNDIANTIEGSPVTRATLYNLTQSRVQANIARFQETLK